jgi:chromosome condensin MukBEF complex kleisin-like MukF subunit
MVTFVSTIFGRLPKPRKARVPPSGVLHGWLRSFQLREARGLAPKENVRNNLTIAELSFVMAAEALAAERIEEELRLGNDECVDASTRSAAAIREAIEADRKNRQARLSNL